MKVLQGHQHFLVEDRFPAAAKGSKRDPPDMPPDPSLPPEEKKEKRHHLEKVLKKPNSMQNIADYVMWHYEQSKVNKRRILVWSVMRFLVILR